MHGPSLCYFLLCFVSSVNFSVCPGLGVGGAIPSLTRVTSRPPSTLPPRGPRISYCPDFSTFSPGFSVSLAMRFTSFRSVINYMGDETNMRTAEQELREKCQYWQKILRLQDWSIYLEVCRARDMPEGAQGHNKIDLLKKKSVIAIRDEVDHHPDSAWPYDAERTLVHELVHLHFETNDPPTTAQYVANEQGVDILAAALVEMDRSKHG